MGEPIETVRYALRLKSGDWHEIHVSPRGLIGAENMLGPEIDHVEVMLLGETLEQVRGRVANRLPDSDLTVRIGDLPHYMQKMMEALGVNEIQIPPEIQRGLDEMKQM